MPHVQLFMSIELIKMCFPGRIIRHVHGYIRLEYGQNTALSEQIEQAFKRKNKENQIKSILTRYDLQTNYNPKILKEIEKNK